jgi:tetratricopeptide (TPR) repeat protein
VQSALGADARLEPRAEVHAGVTTGFDDSLRALLSSEAEVRALAQSESSRSTQKTKDPKAPSGGDSAYSADPLRQGIACYRAGRYAEAFELLQPLDDATALYWQARTLERLERLEDAIQAMERAIQKGGEGFEQRRAETDLEFLRWKRDFVKGLPQSSRTREGKEKPE